MYGMYALCVCGMVCDVWCVWCVYSMCVVCRHVPGYNMCEVYMSCVYVMCCVCGVCVGRCDVCGIYVLCVGVCVVCLSVVRVLCYVYMVCL